MRQNQLRAISILLIAPTTAWQFAAFPYTTGTQKAVKVSNIIINSSFHWVHSSHTESTKASHFPLIYSQIHVTIFPPMAKLLHTLIIKTQQHPQFLYSLCGRRVNARNVSFSKYFRVEIRPLSTCLIKPKIFVLLSDLRSTTVSLKTRNLNNNKVLKSGETGFFKGSRRT